MNRDDTTSENPLPDEIKSSFDDTDDRRYPDWWQNNICEFKDHELGDYHPPVFKDGKYAPVTVEALETEYDVDIKFQSVNPQTGNRWQILVDGEPIADIDRERKIGGISIYQITSDSLEKKLECVVSKKS
jgi:hypothetical protein